MPYIDLDSGTVLNGPLVFVPDEVYGHAIDDTAPDSEVIAIARLIGTPVEPNPDVHCQFCGGLNENHYAHCEFV